MTPAVKNPTKPPIQLIAKPKNLNNNIKSNESPKNIFNSGENRLRSNKPNQNTNKPKPKNFKNRNNTPELVGAPIRREDPNKQNNNKQNISFKQNVPNKSGLPNRPQLRNKPSDQNRPGSFNRQGNPNRTGATNRTGMPNTPSSRFNNQKSSGIRKPVAPNELLQLQKTNKSEKDKIVSNNNEKQNNESPKHKVKAPNNRLNAAPSSKTTS